MQTWEPCYVNMCSYQHDPDQVRKLHAQHLAYYGATEADCELVSVEAARSWERGLKSHYRLNLHTYLGWKVYMLHCGCFASKPQFETAT